MIYTSPYKKNSKAALAKEGRFDSSVSFLGTRWRRKNSYFFGTIQDELE